MEIHPQTENPSGPRGNAAPTESTLFVFLWNVTQSQRRSQRGSGPSQWPGGFLWFFPDQTGKNTA